jgi:hypothetical protein
MLIASKPSDLNVAFASLSEQHPDGVLVGSDPVFVARRDEIIPLAARLRVPVIYPFREIRWFDQLRRESSKYLSAGWCLHWPNPTTALPAQFNTMTAAQLRPPQVRVCFGEVY